MNQTNQPNQPIKITISDLFRRQYEIFNSIINTPPEEVKYHIIRATRQSGKTFLILRLAISFLFSKPNLECAFISGSAKQFKKAWHMFIKTIPTGLILDIVLGENKIFFANGSTLQFFTGANADSVVSNTFDYLIMDEAALYPKDAIGLMMACISAKKKSKCILASTPRGKNEYYDYCMKGMDKEESTHRYKHYKMSYLDNPYYDIKFVEDQRSILPEILFNSEYNAEFQIGKSTAFGEYIDNQTVSEWQEPLRNEMYFGGIDVGADGEDSTVFTIINQAGKICLMVNIDSPDFFDQADIIAPLVLKYKARTKVEKNGVGKGLYDILKKRCSILITSFNASNKSKNEIVLLFKSDLHYKTIQLPTIALFKKLDDEMGTYIAKLTEGLKVTWSHEKGYHDDAIDSVMIANYTKNLYINGSGYQVINNTPTVEPNNYPTASDYQNYIQNKDMYDEDYN